MIFTFLFLSIFDPTSSLSLLTFLLYVILSYVYLFLCFNPIHDNITRTQIDWYGYDRAIYSQHWLSDRHMII